MMSAGCAEAELRLDQRGVAWVTTEPPGIVASPCRQTIIGPENPRSEFETGIR